MQKVSPSNHKTPVYIIIGTRGQFTKTAPVIQEMEKQKIPYFLINTGQHTSSSLQIARIFGIRGGDEFVARREKDIDKFSKAFFWFLKAFCSFMLNIRKFFPKGKGIVIIHGDTLSTLLALIVSRFCGMKVAHIESGLRSYSFFHPFPEEIIRILACRFSHYLFAPSDSAYNNLRQYKAIKFNTCGNTVFDAIKYVEKLNDTKRFDFSYCVVTIHRSELLIRENLLEIALSAVYKASTFTKVIFVVHKATLAKLKTSGEFSKIEKNDGIIVQDYYDYPAFMALVKGAQFVMTDGGGLQEETFLLNVPCLILRKKTERKYGIGSTALLSEMKKEKIDYFLQNYHTFRRKAYEYHYPAKFIAEKLSELI